jgi:hypothetical protein
VLGDLAARPSRIVASMSDFRIGSGVMRVVVAHDLVHDVRGLVRGMETCYGTCVS